MDLMNKFFCGQRVCAQYDKQAVLDVVVWLMQEKRRVIGGRRRSHV